MKGRAIVVWLVAAAGVGGTIVAGHMGDLPGLDGSRATWFTIRSAGITAYLLLTLSTVWGVLTSSRLLMQWIKLPLASELHKLLSFLGLGALGLHGGALLFDQTVPFEVWQVALPFLAPYRPLATGLGVIAAYLMALLVLSFYVRQHLGQRLWRAFHYAGFLAFALGTAHGVFAGTDTGSVWVQTIYLASGAAVLFLTYVRILGNRYVPVRRASTPNATSAGAGPAGTSP